MSDRRGDDLVDTVEQFDRVIQQPLAQVEDGADLAAGDPPAGQFDGGLDERQGEGLGPVAVDGEVGPLGGHHPLVDHAGIAVDVGRNQGDEPGMGVDEVALAVPERVVAVERDDLDAVAADAAGAARECHPNMLRGHVGRR